jgi:hypothetical protein
MLETPHTIRDCSSGRAYGHMVKPPTPSDRRTSGVTMYGVGLNGTCSSNGWGVRFEIQDCNLGASRPLGKGVAQLWSRKI